MTPRLAPLLAALLLAAPALAEPPALAGRWVSAAPEAMGPIQGTRDFAFEADRWSVTFTAFADPEAAQALFRLDVGGRFVLGGPSAAVDGAFEAIFPADRRRITALSEAGVQMFAAQGCALQVGVALDLTSQGCGFVPSLMAAMGEYDLVAMRDGRLFLGDRAADLSKARPTALTPFPLVPG